MKVNKLAFIFIAALTTISCTRAVDDSIKLSLDLENAFPNQKVGSLSGTMEIRRIVVNVTAPDMTPVVYFWSSPCDNGPCAATPPSVIEIGKTPKDRLSPGSNRLVQVLIVGKEMSAGIMAFSYGDKLTELKTGENPVEVSVSPSGIGSNNEGVISGQYALMNVGGAQGFGPSGNLDVLFSPPNGSPKIVVDESEIFNGWFSVIGLEGVPLEYRVRGEPLPIQHNGQAMSFDQIYGILNNNSVALAASMWQSPNEFWVEDSGMGGRRNSGGGINILGFFGPGAASLSSPKVCFSPTLSPNVFYDADTAGNSLGYSTVIGTSADIERLGGGVAWSHPTHMSTCGITTNHNKTILKMDLNNLRNGKHAVAGFFGPFASKDFGGVCGMAGTQMAVGCYNSGMGIQQFNWNYLPDVINSGAISGATLFTKIYPAYCDEACEAQFRIPASDGYQCEQLQEKGFTETYTSLSEGNASYSTSSGNYLPPGGHLVAIVCPFKGVGNDKKYFKSGLRIHGNLQAPPPAVTGLNVTSAGDSADDNWLAESNLSSTSVVGTWTAFAGADHYDIRILNSSNNLFHAYCEVTSINTIFYNFGGGTGTCSQEMNTASDGDELKLEVVARDAMNNTVGMGIYPFKILKTPPNVTNFSNFGCNVDNGGFVQLAMDVTFIGDPIEVTNVKFSSSGGSYLNETQMNAGAPSSNFWSIGSHVTQVSRTSSQTIRTKWILRKQVGPHVYFTPISSPIVKDINYNWNGSVGTCSNPV